MTASCSRYSFGNGLAGDAPHYLPAAHDLRRPGMPHPDPSTAPRSMRALSPIPTCPPITTSSSTTMPPESPVCAAMTTLLPMRQLCAMSYLVVELHTVADVRGAQRRAVDARIRADLHVVADLHIADLRKLQILAALVHELRQKPSAPITAPEWITCILSNQHVIVNA